MQPASYDIWNKKYRLKDNNDIAIDKALLVAGSIDQIPIEKIMKFIQPQRQGSQESRPQS